jgi:hypothetical protein
VTLTAGAGRRVTLIEEVRTTSEGIGFVPLFEMCGGGGRDDVTLEPTGVVDRGESALVADLSRPAESYADVRSLLGRRSTAIERLAETGLTAPDDRGY